MNLLPEERNPHINYGATAGRGQSSMDAGKESAGTSKCPDLTTNQFPDYK